MRIKSAPRARLHTTTHLANRASDTTKEAKMTEEKLIKMMLAELEQEGIKEMFYAHGGLKRGFHHQFAINPGLTISIDNLYSSSTGKDTTVTVSLGATGGVCLALNDHKGWAWVYKNLDIIIKELFVVGREYLAKLLARTEKVRLNYQATLNLLNMEV